MNFDLYDTFSKKKVKNISLQIRVLRTKKERKKHCGYGPGEPSYGHKCEYCEKENTICLAVHEDIDGASYSYVVSDEIFIKSLEKICEPTLKVTR